MKFKDNMIWLDRYDEDRWITASIASLIFLIIAVLILHNIEIPKNPEKAKTIEVIDIIKEEVEKKIIEKKIVEEQPVVDEQVFEEEPEIVLDVFDETPQQTTLPQDMPFAADVQLFQEESQEMEEIKAITQINEGTWDETTEIDPLNVEKGMQSDWSEESIETIVSTSKTGTDEIKERRGLSTTIRAEKTKNIQFAGHVGDIKWEDILDPILDWVSKNRSDIGKVPTFRLTNRDKSAITAKNTITVNGVNYLLFLVSKESKRQLTICLVDLKSLKYVTLIDQGLTRASSIFEVGTVTKKEDIIINFSGSRKSTDDPTAKEFMDIFWSWATSVTN